ncbi:sigma factor [Pseudobacteroides cellulosolvens]|uniref:Sigma-70 region 2 domain protein n=1 Tax=Pseudobacteroides cellulosolvens ATCC 35603 = DSM 2933 TaxID=398512 RepID=A0A0L6JJT7_9FIRM|nr:sigma factor [Pseudobacteroides cellulosolvens]KNY25968.1 sigma-70 region 2 domain protein [Pseudobacteroides cellulosolvens ATCC 35603 = DSM 2933]
MDALTSLYSELAEPLTRYAMTFIRDISLVEDIVSETFLRATKHCIANNELPARLGFIK